MNLSFKSEAAKTIFEGNYTRELPENIQTVAKRKLNMMVAAKDLNDLRVPPANRLEKLKGNRKGQHSIRINDQWRICFEALPDSFKQIEIVDYH